MIRVIGEGIIEQASAFNDLKSVLDFDQDIYLGAMWANILGIELRGRVIYNTEFLYDESPLFGIGYLDTLRNNIILDYSAGNVSYLKQHGIEAFHMPYGYHPSLERPHFCEKDIDVLFVGSNHHQRRIDLFAELSKHCRLVIAKGCYGEDLDRLIARAKVHINLHHVEGQPLEVVRLNYLMANHGNVVSEYGPDSDVNHLYESGLRFADYGELIDSCMDALKAPIDGYETIKTIPHNCTEAKKWIKNY